MNTTCVYKPVCSYSLCSLFPQYILWASVRRLLEVSWMNHYLPRLSSIISSAWDVLSFFLSLPLEILLILLGLRWSLLVFPLSELIIPFSCPIMTLIAAYINSRYLFTQWSPPRGSRSSSVDILFPLTFLLEQRGSSSWHIVGIRLEFVELNCTPIWT